MPYALCPMPYALCPMPYARLSSVYLMLLRKAIYFSGYIKQTRQSRGGGGFIILLILGNYDR
jgi:hypothetical protein